MLVLVGRKEQGTNKSTEEVLEQETYSGLERGLTEPGRRVEHEGQGHEHGLWPLDTAALSV